jgi:hypothetical protein
MIKLMMTWGEFSVDHCGHSCFDEDRKFTVCGFEEIGGFKMPRCAEDNCKLLVKDKSND